MEFVPRTYTLSEISRLLETPPTTIKSWEKALEGVYEVSKDSSGKRQYTDEEVEVIRTIKAMRESGVGFELIRERMQQKDVQDEGIVPTNESTNSLITMQNFIKVMSKQLRKEIAEEIRSEMDVNRREVEEARKQIEVLQQELEETRKLVASASETIEQGLKDNTQLKQQNQQLHIEVESVQKRVAYTHQTMDAIRQEMSGFIAETRADKIKREEAERNKPFWQRLFGK